MGQTDLDISDLPVAQKKLTLASVHLIITIGVMSWNNPHAFVPKAYNYYA